MPRPQKSADSLDKFTLHWTQLMLQTLVDSLEKQHDLGKRSDTGWKPEAWSVCLEDVQSVYTGTEVIPLEKLKAKLDYVSARHYFFWLRRN